MEKFGEPVLLTFTVDRRNFSGPEEAHEVVTGGGYIRRLLKLLGIDVWVWVLEFQEAGWPHWHVIVDVSGPGRLHREELRRMWHLWRDKWGIGGLDVEEQKSFETAKHAMFYITKYLMGGGKNPFPAWFLEGKRRRLCQGSQKVGRLVMGEKRQEESKGAGKSRSDARSLRERMCECGLRSSVIGRWLNEETLEERVRHVGDLSIGKEGLLRLCESGVLPEGVSVVRRDDLRMGYTARRVYVEGELCGMERKVREIECGLMGLGVGGNDKGRRVARERYFLWRDRVEIEGVSDEELSRRLEVRETYWRIVEEAGCLGWSVRKPVFSRDGRSAYVKLNREGKGKVVVRISDHGSVNFKADCKGVWSVRVGRGGGSEDAFLKMLRKWRRSAGQLVGKNCEENWEKVVDE